MLCYLGIGQMLLACVLQATPLLTETEYTQVLQQAAAANLQQIVHLDQLLKAAQDDPMHLSTSQLREAYEAAIALERPEVATMFLHLGMQGAEPGFFLIEHYRHLLMQGLYQEAAHVQERIRTLDPQNHKGYLYQLALIDFQAGAARALPLEQVIQPLCEYVAQFGALDSEHVWCVEMMLAQCYLDQDEWRLALQHAELAYQQAPPERRGALDHTLEYIRKQASQAVALSDTPYTIYRK